MLLRIWNVLIAVTVSALFIDFPNTDKDYYYKYDLVCCRIICYYYVLIFDSLSTSTTNNQLIIIDSKQ